MSVMRNEKVGEKSSKQRLVILVAKVKESTGTVSSVGTEFVTDERKGNQKKKKKYKGSYFKN